MGKGKNMKIGFEQGSKRKMRKIIDEV